MGLELLEAAYAWERSDDAWIEGLVDETCRLWTHSVWGYGYFYDASDIHRVRVWNVYHRDSPAEARVALQEVVSSYSPRSPRRAC